MEWNVAANGPIAKRGRLSVPSRREPRVMLGALLIAALIQPAIAAKVDIPGPDAGTRRFGTDIVVLPNRNYLVTDPEWSGGLNLDLAGAVYLFGTDGTLLSRITGATAGDRVGSGGIVVLANGNFVVRSPSWRASATNVDMGAVTWGDSVAGFGLSTTVSAANSLVGSSDNDMIGSAVVALANGSFVVASGAWDRKGVAKNAGAVTWCAADGSIIGPVTDTNSLVGSAQDDQVGDTTVSGTAGVIALPSGHYVVASSRWDRGSVVDAGAVTWGSNDGSVFGEVGAANSLLGVRTGDYVGAQIQALANGHYIVQSPYLDTATALNVGAVTWADGNLPSTGDVSAANSLVGSQLGDQIGSLAAVLSNGHYVVASPFWDAAAVPNVGAVTWRDGNGPGPGVVDAANSLVGSHAHDNIGYFTTIGIPPLGVVPLSDGDYVVASPEWDHDAVLNVGAATWSSGAAGIVGPVSVDNSIIGAAAGDAIAQFIVPLANGNYVVASPFWSERRGAATWGSGEGGSVGAVGENNSLVGSQPQDFISASGIYRLRHGDYAVASQRWSNGDTLRVGAVTRGSGIDGIAGPVSPQNSVIGSEENAQAGAGGVVPLLHGDYLVQSELASGLGAITRIAFPTANSQLVVDAANSLVGVSEDDRIGFPGAAGQPDGAIVVHVAGVAADNAGAIALLDASDPFIGNLQEASTVRSAVAGGGPLLNYEYVHPTGTLLVGDPLGNRIVRLDGSRLMRDGFESFDESLRRESPMHTRVISMNRP